MAVYAFVYASYHTSILPMTGYFLEIIIFSQKYSSKFLFSGRTFIFVIPLNTEIRYRGVEQLVARRAHNPEVASSSLVPATKKSLASFACKGFFVDAFSIRPPLLYPTSKYKNGAIIVVTYSLMALIGNHLNISIKSCNF